VIHLLLEVSRIVPMPGPTTPLAAVLVFAIPSKSCRSRKFDPVGFAL
jgi:hypothetical protein